MNGKSNKLQPPKKEKLKIVILAIKKVPMQKETHVGMCMQGETQIFPNHFPIR